MYIVAIGWAYVVMMMSIAEDSAVAGVMTFLLYGAVPVTLILYVGGAGARKRRRAAAQAQAREQTQLLARKTMQDEQARQTANEHASQAPPDQRATARSDLPDGP